MPASSKGHAENLSEHLRDLSLSQTAGGSSSSSARKPPAKQPIADSWEDDDYASDPNPASDDAYVDPDADLLSSPTLPPPRIPKPAPDSPSSSSLAPPPLRSQQQQSSSLSFAPDGTPIAPASATGTSAPPNTPTFGAGGERRRPEKTTGPAARMIAGALGVRAPKKTEEQRQYDKAVRDKEARRREEERERKRRDDAERERLTREAWDG